MKSVSLRSFQYLVPELSEWRIVCIPVSNYTAHYLEPVYTGWSNVHWNDTGLPLVDQCTLGYHWVTWRILAWYTGTPLEKLSWNCPTLECHWRNSIAGSTGTPLDGLEQPTHTQAHMIKQSSIHASLKWQHGGTPNGQGTGLCKFSLYLEFTALQSIPILLIKRVSTSTSLGAWFWYEHHYRICVFWVAVQMKSVKFKQLSSYQLYT